MANVQAIREAVHAVDPKVPVFEAQTLVDAVTARLAPQQLACITRCESQSYRSDSGEIGRGSKRAARFSFLVISKTIIGNQWFLRHRSSR